MVTLIYNASKLAADRIGALLSDQQAAWFLFFKIQYPKFGTFLYFEKEQL